MKAIANDAFVTQPTWQAEELCQMLSRRIKRPWIQALRRVRHTNPQAQLEKEERLTNLK